MLKQDAGFQVHIPPHLHQSYARALECQAGTICAGTGFSLAMAESEGSSAAVKAELPEAPKTLMQRIETKFHAKVKQYGHIGTYLEKTWDARQDEFYKVAHW